MSLLRLRSKYRQTDVPSEWVLYIDEEDSWHGSVITAGHQDGIGAVKLHLLHAETGKQITSKHMAEVHPISIFIILLLLSFLLFYLYD